MPTSLRKLNRRTSTRSTPKMPEMPEIDLSDTNPLIQLNMAAANVVSKGSVTAKETRESKRLAQTRAAKAPVSKAATKAAAKKAAAKKAAAKKAEAKAAAKKARITKAAKAASRKSNVKSSRQHNTRPTSLDTFGICVGPARVKKVLVQSSMNRREFRVRTAIAAAENKPAAAKKPTPENPDPKAPVQGPQLNIEDMHPSYLAVIREAEAVHENAVREGYERKTLGAMDADTRNAYLDLRKEAHAKINAANLAITDDTEPTVFDLHTFNTEYDSKFYDGYAEYAKVNDSYVIGKNYNQWSLASALVNKLSTRLSGNTRYIVAAFLDRIVEQYAHNGIHNCLLEGLHIVKLRHALTMSDGFNARVPLDAFVKTFKNYDNALNWIDECRNVRDKVRELRAERKDVDFVMPSYPVVLVDADFDNYVGEICRSVRMRLSESQPADSKNNYLDTSVSREFKKFCSYIIYEAILRIGAILRTTVTRDSVKTVSDTMVHYALEQIHNVCGLDFAPASKIMNARLAKYASLRAARKAERFLKKSDATDGDQLLVEDESNDADDAEDAEDVEDASDADSDSDVNYEDA